MIGSIIDIKSSNLIESIGLIEFIINILDIKSIANVVDISQAGWDTIVIILVIRWASCYS